VRIGAELASTGAFVDHIDFHDDRLYLPQRFSIAVMAAPIFIALTATIINCIDHK
jgi:hypothetical protein